MEAWLDELLDIWEDYGNKGIVVSIDDLRQIRPEWFEACSTLDTELAMRIRKLSVFRQRVLDPEAQTVDDRGVSLPRFLDYDVERMIGSGAMGQVFLAKDVQLGHLVAIKVIQPRTRLLLESDRRRLASRFVREAQTLASLNHPHIVRVLAGKPRADSPYFAMEFLPRSLADAGERQALNKAGPRAVVEFMVKVVKAVHYAHTQGVLHRDLKPGNILIDSNGDPKVADFGLAKLVFDEDDVLNIVGKPEIAALADHETSGPLTLPGTQPGTPAYMAPEQYLPGLGPVDARTDVFALGVVLYWLLSGGHPFLPDATSRPNLEVMRNALRGAKPRLLKDARLSKKKIQQLNKILETCLATSNVDRYSSAQGLATALEEWLHEEKPIVAPMTRWERAWTIVGKPTVLFIVLSFVALLVVAPLWRSQSETPYVRETKTLVQDLKDRKPVVLIGSKDRPPTFTWRKGDGDATPSGDSSGAMRITAQGPALVELLPEVPLARYRIIAEIFHEAAFSEKSEVGVYCCYEAVETPQIVHHLFVKTSFADTGRLATAFVRKKGRCSMASLSLFDFVRDFRAEKQPHDFRMQRGMEFYFIARKEDEQRVRRLTVEVNGSTSIKLQWDDDETPKSESEPLLLGFFSDLRKHHPELQERNTSYKPDGALGVFVDSSCLEVKSLRIEPME
jgi:serine/threonine protein kinase